MKVTVQLPEDVAAQICVDGQDVSRAVLHAVAIEGYRSGSLTPEQIRRMLGFDTWYQLDGFLKEYRVCERTYSAPDFEQDGDLMQRLETERED
jgi:hypothetical protein